MSEEICILPDNHGRADLFPLFYGMNGLLT